MFSVSTMFRAAVLFVGCAALLSPASAGTQRGGVSTPLTLINGWQNGPSGTANASVEALNGIVHFKGAISQTGSQTNPFVMPAPFRPASKVYVSIDACKATNARLDISADGTVSVESEGSFDKAKCLVSLDGATFALSTDGFKSLKLKHGWGPHGFGTGNAALQTIDGMVHFEGAIGTGKKNPIPFILPGASRPGDVVYVKTNLCNAANGRLQIDPDGTVRVEAEKHFSDAKCFTSLDGVSFALSNGFTNLSLINGWENYIGGSRPASVHEVNGVVQFQGAIDTSGTDPNAFVLPANFRPSKTVYLPVDMCDATNGRLVIKSNGTTTVEAEKSFGNAQCFTSLEGVSFLQ